MKTHKCPVCGEEYELMHICLKNYYDRFLQQFQESEKCPDCGHEIKKHHGGIGCLAQVYDGDTMHYCSCAKTYPEIPYKPATKESGIKCPNCGHETKRHSKCGCMQKITTSDGNTGFCPCNKPYEISSDKPEPKESGIKCPDCGCDVNLHSDVDKNDCPIMNHYGCNNHKAVRDIDYICSCNLNFEDALNKAVEYAGMYLSKTTALMANYEWNKPEPQTCVVCDDTYTKREDIDAGVIFATIDHTRFVCETCHRKIIKCVADRRTP